MLCIASFLPGGKWAVAMHLLKTLPDLGILPDLRLYNTVLGSLLHGALALELQRPTP